MALTKAELRNRTLQALGVLASGQSASGEDAALMDNVIDEAFDQYEDVLPFVSSSTPGWASDPMVAVIAARAAALFGNAPVARRERDALADIVTARNAPDTVVTQKPAAVDYF